MKKSSKTLLACLALIAAAAPVFGKTPDTSSEEYLNWKRQVYRQVAQDVARTLAKYIGDEKVYGNDGKILKSFYNLNLTPVLCVAPTAVDPGYIHPFAGAYNIKANYWLHDIRNEIRVPFALAASEICDKTRWATNTPHYIIRRIQSVY